MGTILNRFERGVRWWPAEIVLRCAGLCLLRLCAAIIAPLSRLLHQPPHATRPVEFAVAALAFLAWSFGSALLLEGSALFKLADLPARHWHPLL